MWFLNNDIPRQRRLKAGEHVPAEFSFLVLATSLQMAFVVALLEGEFLHYDLADPGPRLHTTDCLLDGLSLNCVCAQVCEERCTIV